MPNDTTVNAVSVNKYVPNVIILVENSSAVSICITYDIMIHSL